MKSEKAFSSPHRSKILRRLYVLTFIVMAFTGFGQMPLFKRYYIADIPGMAWSADFYATHVIHYYGAIVLLGLFAYAAADFLLVWRKTYRISPSGYARLAIMAGIVGTGVFRVLKNLPDVVFSPGFTLFIDLAHLGFMMVYLVLALVFAVKKSSWLVRASG